jgi:hypothetical protein
MISTPSTQQDFRVAEHGHGHAEPLAHAEREAAGPLVRHVLQADQGQHLLDPARGQALSLGQEQQVVPGTAPGVHGLGLEILVRSRASIMPLLLPSLLSDEAAGRKVPRLRRSVR